MGKQTDLYKRWRRARSQLDEIFRSPESTLVIHYSCESFYDREVAQSPRITSVAVRNLDSGQTRSFSIHLVAERRGQLGGIDEHYDALEREMLDDFFNHAQINQNNRWLHWNMRDANYGFPALEQRHRALGGVPFHINERNLFDLSRILIGVFGVTYIGHPRLENLMNLNRITAMDFLTGQDEGNAFVNKQFVRLHQSTLRKVDVLANIAERAHNGSLKVLSSWWERNGRSFKAALEIAKEHWVISGISFAIVAAGIAQKIFRLFG